MADAPPAAPGSGARMQAETLRALIEHSSDIIAVLDAEGSIRFESPAVERFLGYAPQEVLGRPVWEFIHPEDVARAREVLAMRARDLSVSRPTRFRVRHRDGSWRVHEAVGSNRLHDPFVAGIVLNSRDVTERVRMEESLRESEARYRSLFARVQEGLFLVERAPDGRLRYAEMNDALERIIGIRREDFIGRSPHEVFPKMLAERVSGMYERVLAEGRPLSIEHTNALPAGRVSTRTRFHPVMDPEGRVVRVVGLVEDVTEQRAAREALERSEQRFRMAMEHAPIGIALVSIDGRWLMVNRALCGIVGYTEAELLRLSYRDITHPADLGADLEHVRSLLAGEAASYQLEKRYLRRDGREVWIFLTGSLVRDERGEPLYFIVQALDVDERKRAEEALRESERRYRDLFESSSDGIYISERNGTIVDANPAMCRLTGYSREELAEINAAWLYADPVERDRFRGEIEASGSVRDFPVRLRHRDGTPREVLLTTSVRRGEDGRILGYQGRARDVTDWARAERTTRQLAAIVESSSDAIVSETLDGTVLSWNKAAEEIYGYTAGEMIGRPSSALRPRVLAEEEASIRARLARGEHIESHETVRLRRDGTRIDVSLALSPIRDEAGEIVSASIIARDITEAKRAEAELRRARDAAEAASRAKSEFLSGMSHELRTPLNSVIGFTNVLRKNRAGNLREQDLAYLERIRANGMHLLGLINDVLDLSKIEAGKMSVELAPVELRELIRGTMEELQGGVPPGVELRVELPEEPALVETDPRKLKQILINLTGNALKFTEAGSVTVAVELHPETGRPARIEVRDTGVGIPGDRLEAIFEAFEQAEVGTARRYGGTGLGLAISASLARLLGCRLTVESRPGEGSTFRVELGAAPAAKPPAPEVALEAPAPDELRTEGLPREFEHRLVLVIDDDPDSRFILGEAIAEHGCEILTASSGERGLELAREVRPDLITLDLVMQDGMSGWDTLQALKADPGLCDIPVVVVSVLAEENRGTLLGAVDLLRKPPAPEDLRRVLRRNLGGRPWQILVVDDDEATRLRIVAAIREEGVEVHTAASGREALNVLEGFSPDLIFLDLLMPGMDGPEVLARLRESRPELRPTIVVATERSCTSAELERIRQEVEGVVEREHGDLETVLRQELGRICGSRVRRG